MACTVSKSEIETPVLLEDATHLYAPEVWGTPGAVPVQLEGAVLAQWLLEPHDYPIPAGAPIRVANSFGLPAGAAVTLYVGRYAESDWVPVGTATVAEDWITFDAELELVSTLVLVQAP